RKIIENKGGSIRVESEMGSGATFRFSVPKAKKPAAADFSPVVYDLN
ncbi:MAG: hypothetical protein JNL88_04895, partial [Bacteroidia bacterium]|nr:hypothetical protein [Bacteroidia bacterium]